MKRMARLGALLGVAALGLAGCWTDSCVTQDPVLAIDNCQEYLTTIFDDPSAGGPAFCGGTSDFGSCPDNGFTVRCGQVWVRPESAPRATCR